MKPRTSSHDRTPRSRTPLWIVAGLLLVLGCRDVTTPSVLPPAVPPSPAPPIQTGSLFVRVATTGTDADADGYVLAIAFPEGTRTQPFGGNDSVTIASVQAGDLTVELMNVASNCWVSGGRQQTVAIWANATTPLIFGVTCESVSENVGPHALVGVWEAKSWEFFENAEHTSSFGDLIGSGVSGTLTVTNDGGSEIGWHWRETYRWWGPNRPTIIKGHAEVSGGSLQSFVDEVVTEFECDMGDCDGPLHGEYRFAMNASILIIARAKPILYYAGRGPRDAWTQLVLERLQ
jgi:hypothetical protein